MPEIYLMILLLVHFFADFGLQTHDQATKKCVSMKWLLYHTGVYSACWLLVMIPILGGRGALVFAMITLVLHTATDYLTSRIGKPFWEAKDFHNGFVIVGFDQVLHYVQLYLTLKYLIHE